MSDQRAMIVACVLLLGALCFGIWWASYKYSDCIRVGHTKTYCILDIGH